MALEYDSIWEDWHNCYTLSTGKFYSIYRHPELSMRVVSLRCIEKKKTPSILKRSSILSDALP